MGLEVRKKTGESTSTLLFNFSKRVKRSGILREARARRFHKRDQSRLKRRMSAVHREQKKKEIERDRKLGVI